jgi:hypothetical protein
MGIIVSPPGRWRQQVPPKHWYPSIKQHSIISQDCTLNTLYHYNFNSHIKIVDYRFLYIKLILTSQADFHPFFGFVAEDTATEKPNNNQNNKNLNPNFPA